jgi:DNA-binding IclR family transcriptional regulator
MATQLSRDTDALPNSLESTSSKLVYLYLDTTGEATVSEMADALGMQKLALFSILDTLRSMGLVDGDGTSFSAAR